MERRYKALNIALTCVIVIGTGLLAFFVYKESYMRVGEAFSDLWNSLKFFVKEVFLFDFEAEPTVLEYSEVLEWENILPEDWSNFTFKFKAFFSLFATGENFDLYMDGIGTGLANFSKSLVVIIPIGLVFWLIIKAIYAKCNTKHNRDTIPLKLYKGITRITVVPIRNFLKQYIKFYT